jgi:hypothetical protein
VTACHFHQLPPVKHYHQEHVVSLQFWTDAPKRILENEKNINNTNNTTYFNVYDTMHPFQQMAIAVTFFVVSSRNNIESQSNHYEFEVVPAVQKLM